MLRQHAYKLSGVVNGIDTEVFDPNTDKLIYANFNAESLDKKAGTVKSSVGLGILLHEGIGDTLRVSLTADPVEEVAVAWEILRALGLRSRGPEIISCPTCGRTEIDLFSLLRAVEDRLATTAAPIKVAVMGCVVNGPGEAREADIGLAGGRDKGIIFRKGQVVRVARGQEALLAAFMEELQKLLDGQGASPGAGEA